MKHFLSAHRFRFGFQLACLTAMMSLAPAISFAQSAPFAGLAGAWSGSGSILLANGSSERIKCRATYAVGDRGNGLQQTLRCASDSYKFELSSNVKSTGGQVIGTWFEATRNVSGDLQGRAGNGLFQVLVTSPAFTANVNLVTRGNSQTVKITSQGTEFSGVTITLARS